MATVLPWRRTQQQARTDEIAELLAEYRRRRPKADTSTIVRAWRDASAAHEGQHRRSGEPYITHPVAVATILAGLGLDDVLATGGTAAAAVRLLQGLGAEVVGLGFLLELAFLEGRALLPAGVPVHVAIGG